MNRAIDPFHKGPLQRPVVLSVAKDLQLLFGDCSQDNFAKTSLNCTAERYNGSGRGRGMIVGFRDKWLLEFFLHDRKSRFIPPDLEARLFRKIQLVDDALSDADLRSPPSNHFEKLRGELVGWHSIRVNEQWRLIFRWNSDRGEATGLYLDNHSYR